ncbi:MAG: hypothetical protein WDO73_25035 [Ignavibacteriota bacterium]
MRSTDRAETTPTSLRRALSCAAAAAVGALSSWRICATASFTWIAKITLPISGDDFRASLPMPFLWPGSLTAIAI